MSISHHVIRANTLKPCYPSCHSLAHLILLHAAAQSPCRTAVAQSVCKNLSSLGSLQSQQPSLLCIHINLAYLEDHLLHLAMYGSLQYSCCLLFPFHSLLAGMFVASVFDGVDFLAAMPCDAAGDAAAYRSSYNHLAVSLTPCPIALHSLTTCATALHSQLIAAHFFQSSVYPLLTPFLYFFPGSTFSLSLCYT